MMAFAGLWDEWHSPDGSPVRSCTIITTNANDFMKPWHDRMPAILRREDEDTWLDPEARNGAELLELLHPYPEGELTAHPVSTRMNKPVYDTPDCIEPLVDDGDEG
jgi:putative SOS response-associated peptidase YedK